MSCYQSRKSLSSGLSFPLAAVFAAALALSATPAQAGNGSGTLDPSFGEGGVATTSVFTTGVRVEALYGTIVVGAGTSVRRYLADGSPDVTFGTDGSAPLPVSPGRVTDVAVQVDGSILAALDTSGPSGLDGHFTLVRYYADGSLDGTFGVGGVVTVPIGPNDSRIDALSIQPDGRILAAGSTAQWILGYTWGRQARDFAVARYNTDGSLDASFGAGGIVETDFAGGSDAAHSVVVQADGRIVVGGTATSSTTGQDWALARYGVDGTLDATFGAEGLVTTHINGGNEQLKQIALQAGGEIVAVGSSSNTAAAMSDYAIARYDANGGLDATFGTGGLVITDFDGGADYGISLGIQSDGGIIVAGNTQHIDHNGQVLGFDVGVRRYYPDGDADTRFGSRGVARIDLGDDRATHLAIQADGKIVLGGSALVRLLP